MQVLVLGKRGADRRRVVEALTDSDHTIHECFDGTGTWGCAALTGECPISGAIDVAVATPDAISSGFSPQGAGCAAREGTPFVAIGTFSDDPIIDFADLTLDEVDDDFVSRLATLADPRH